MAVAAEVKIGNMLEAAGCELNGPNAWDPQVHKPEVYGRILRGGVLAVGKTYVEGLWDCAQLDELSARVGGLDSPVKYLGKRTVARSALSSVGRNLQSLGRAQQNVEHHYDIGNELYEAMLGETMAYSCGYWEGDVKTLDDAQRAKFDLICRKLGFEAGMKVLDIGCGWGGFLKHAVERYGVEAVGITLASEQVKYIRENSLGFEVKLIDWRELEDEEFDRVVSVGMFEHVGPKNYPDYFERVRRLTAPDGLSLLHTIGAPKRRYVSDPWITKYIFPGGHIPSEQQISKASKDHFVIADKHEMGPNYDRTLMAWSKNFKAAWPELLKATKPDGSPRYDKGFGRMWDYYLETCAGSFRNASNLLLQLVLSDEAAAEAYQPIR